MDENFCSDMWWGTLGTIRPFPNFHPDRDAADIQAALERKDMTALVRILTNRNNAQRQAVAQSFQDKTKQDLSGALKKVLSGQLEELLLQLMMPPEQLEAQRLRAAMAGLGTDEETLLEILCSRSRKTLQEVAAVYRQMYKKDLEKELKAETSGDFGRLVVALLNKAVTASSVQRDVQALAASLSEKKAEAGPWISILTSRDSDHLDKVLMELELETGQTVDQLVEKRFSGDFRLGLRVLGESRVRGLLIVGLIDQLLMVLCLCWNSSVHPGPRGLPRPETAHHEDVAGSGHHGVPQRGEPAADPRGVPQAQRIVSLLHSAGTF
ncbi:annexin A2 isoform X1 [Gambusia affinis]|uniref:annexin A2 isoform X1 n=1 Tax=Gambusia affinis TaxID=33528 RepID=UPI001CDD2E89|nr:annexin A2 isoform X1 [Gambusia affinis]